ncbi:ParM/StbA family protein [Risungbinella massiliensis]|uniref:ParM/StbA family protein n=1 Tax=Risungbinella massiliensis TaxID=1329796 RepID=UPI0005CBA5BC|nr:hypothetical protein [Risungbinella massiliensis]
MDLVAVDAGRSFTKVKVGNRVFEFPSKVSKALEGHRDQMPGDLEVRYQGKDYFVGRLAEREGYAWTNMLETKVHEQTLIEILTACFLAEVVGKVAIMTSIPINMYSKEMERSGLKKLLVGDHEILVNGVYRKLQVEKVGIGLECACSYFNHKRPGKVRIIDPGARTTNFATYQDGIYIGKESGTISYGWDSVRGSDPDLMANLIISEIGKSWSTSDQLEIIGGRAQDLELPMQKQGFVHTHAVTDAKYANVTGLYEIGRNLISVQG